MAVSAGFSEIVTLVLTVFFLGLLVWMWMKRSRWLLPIGIVLFLFLGFGTYSVYKYLKTGFDDGPFFPETLSQMDDSFILKESIQWKKGRLSVYEAPNHPLTVSYEEKDGRKKFWMQKLSLKELPGFKIRRISSLYLSRNIFLEEELGFTACWDFGCEKGRAVLSVSGIREYYLSW